MMGAASKDTTIGALCDSGYAHLQTGPFGTQLHSHDYLPDGVPVVPTEAIQERGIDAASLPKISPAKALELERHRLVAGDLLFARRGVRAAGRVSFVRLREEGYICGTGAIRLRLRANAPISAEYLSHVFANPTSVAWFKDHAVGATMPNLNEKIIRSFPLKLPPVRTQRCIAAVLSVYDELIENNQKRIRVLEEMARSLYREWFARFNCPEVGPPGVAPLKCLPHGWRVCSLGDIAENFDSRRVPLSSMERAKRRGTYPYYGAAKIVDYIDGYIFDGRYLLVAEDGSVRTEEDRPVLQLVEGKFWVNNHTHVLRGTGAISTEVLYLRLMELNVSPYITGAAQPKITQSNLNRIPIVVADEQTHRKFDANVQPLLSKVLLLERKNRVLSAARDLLLPRLLSGELDVSRIPDPAEVAEGA